MAEQKPSDKTLEAYCDCVKQKTTWVFVSRWIPCSPTYGGTDAKALVGGWECLNCGKFRPLSDPG